MMADNHVAILDEMNSLSMLSYWPRAIAKYANK